MEAFEKKTAAEWKEILTAADIPFALCQNWIEIRNDKQAEANNCFYDMTHSNGNTRRLVRTPSSLKIWVFRITDVDRLSVSRVLMF